MENIIKGLDLLEGIGQSDIDQMEQAALLLWRHHKLEFKILEYSDKKVTVRVTQEKSSEQFSVKKLVEQTHSLFDQFLSDKKLLVHPIQYKENPVDIVNPQWIQDKMLKSGVTLKVIAEDTGLNKTYLSTLINGGKDISQAMKAMFYYYFLWKETEQKKVNLKEKKFKS